LWSGPPYSASAPLHLRIDGGHWRRVPAVNQRGSCSSRASLHVERPQRGAARHLSQACKTDGSRTCAAAMSPEILSAPLCQDCMALVLPSAIAMNTRSGAVSLQGVAQRGEHDHPVLGARLRAAWDNVWRLGCWDYSRALAVVEHNSDCSACFVDRQRVRCLVQEDQWHARGNAVACVPTADRVVRLSEAWFASRAFGVESFRLSKPRLGTMASSLSEGDSMSKRTMTVHYPRTRT
jgi:hypothetical protein